MLTEDDIRIFGCFFTLSDMQKLRRFVVHAVKEPYIQPDGTHWRALLKEVLEEGLEAKGRNVDVRFGWDGLPGCNVLRQVGSCTPS